MPLTKQKLPNLTEATHQTETMQLYRSHQTETTKFDKPLSKLK